jgi:Winged helix DNA-binding domain
LWHHPAVTDGPISDQALRRKRIHAQLISGRPARTVTDVVDRLLAVQAQDYRGAALAVRARTTGVNASDLDRALTDDRSVVISTLNRGTLHLVRTGDYWWLHDLTTPGLFTQNARRLRDEGVSAAAAERGVAAVVAALAHGPADRKAIRERVAAAHVPVEGQALAHVLLLATLRGLVLRGPVRNGQQVWVSTTDWLGPRPRPVPRDEALGRLAARYLAGHGPATAADLARWSGLTLGDARRGLSAIDGPVREYRDGLVDLAKRPRGPTGTLPPRLLGQFDPLLLGWTSRELFLGEHERRLVTTNGIFRPFALVDEHVVATWGLSGRRVQVRPFAPIAADDRAALDAEAQRVEAFLAR